jgi:hypothetical protein
MPVTTTPFLDEGGPKDRQFGRVALFVAATLVVGSLVVLAVSLGVTLAFAAQRAAAAHTGLAGFADALGVLTNSGRKPRSLASYAYEFLVAGLASYAAAMVALLLASRIFGRRLRSFLTAARRFRWTRVGTGFALGLPLVALAFAAERLASHEPLAAPILTPGEPLAGRAAYAVLAAVCLYLAAFAEEALFRGWLLQQTAAWTRRLPVILAVNGLFFSLAHFDPSLSGFLVRMVMGAGWAWLAIRTAGVEFTTGAHLANNLFVALFVAPVKFVAPAKSRGDGSIVPALVELALILAMVAAVEAWLRRRPAPSLAQQTTA